MTYQNTDRIRVSGLNKQFILHQQHGVVVPVFSNLVLTVAAGECVVLAGPSGCGKSTLLRCLYGNYLPDSGHIAIHHQGRWLDIVQAPPRHMLALRRHVIGYVPQFLRVLPRVPTLDIVAAPLEQQGTAPEMARKRAQTMLRRVNIPENLWSLSPTTFSGGEQQRVGIARAFAPEYPIMLLDEPTASLDRDNALGVTALIQEAKSNGAAIVAICHDESVRGHIADRLFNLRESQRAA